MIELFFFSLYFWSRYWTYLSSTFDPLGSFSRTAHVITKQHRKWSKNFCFHKKGESWRGIFLTKTKTSKSSKYPVAFSLTCTYPWPKRWPPEPPSWSLLSLQEFLRMLGSALVDEGEWEQVDPPPRCCLNGCPPALEQISFGQLSFLAVLAAPYLSLWVHVSLFWLGRYFSC